MAGISCDMTHGFSGGKILRLFTYDHCEFRLPVHKTGGYPDFLSGADDTAPISFEKEIGLEAVRGNRHSHFSCVVVRI
jgi:hypothetical protein